MKKTVTGKILSFILSFVMITTCLPVTCVNTFAENSAAQPLTVGYSRFSGKFSPFFAETAYDQDVAKMVSVNLLDVDRQGAVVELGKTGETRKYNGTDYTYSGPADLTVTQNNDGTVYYDFNLRENIRFSDGERLTADDVIFSMYVLSDPTYDGSSTFFALPIKGMKEYRAGMETLFNLIVAAGRNNTDYSKWTRATQTAFWTALDTAGVRLAQGIVDYCKDNGYADSGATVAECAELWGYSIGQNATVSDFYYAMVDAYDGNYIDLFSVESTGPSLSEYMDNYNDYAVGVRIGNSADSISGIIKTGEYSLRIITTKFDATAIYNFGIPIAPLHYYGNAQEYNYNNNSFGFDKGNLSHIREKNAEPIGAGPYKLIKYENGEVHFAANQYYYLGTPKTETVIFRELDDGDKLNALINGNVDITDPYFTQDTANAIKNTNTNGQLNGDRIKTVTVDNLGYGYLGISANAVNVGNNPGSAASKNLRKALATVIANYRQESVDSYYGDTAEVINYPISDTSWAAPQKNDSDYSTAFSKDINGNSIYTDNMTAAQRKQAALNAALGYFRAAGYTVSNGRVTAAPAGAALRFEALIPGDGTGDHPSYLMLANAATALAEIGITLVIKDFAYSNMLWESIEDGTAQMWCAAWGATPDPDMYQIYYSGIESGNEPGGSNYMYDIADAQLDTLIMDARSSDDLNYRKAKYKQCLDIILDWAVEIPVYQRQNAVVFSAERVDIDTVTPDITTYYSWIEGIKNIEMTANNSVDESDFEYTVSNNTATITKYNGSATNLTIPSTLGGYSVTSIGDWAFNGCTSLTSITIPDSVTSIGNAAFEWCTNLKSITIPDSVTSIGGFVFEDCTSLTSIAIPDSVTSIGDYAFRGCSSLTSITIPDSVTSIGDYAFFNCTSLESITVDSNNANYSSANGVLFNKDKTVLICYPAGKTNTAYIIPDSVTSICDGAFYGCTALTSVTIGNSVTSISHGAFEDCTSLTSVTIPDSVTSIGDGAFYGCTALTSVTIGNSVTSIGWSAFYGCTSLTSVTIGNSVTSIGWYAFRDCSSLASVTIPDSVTSIGGYAFGYCTSLTSITIPDSVTGIGDSAFFRCTSLTSVTIPDSVKSIEESAFSNCSSLTSITIPDSVTSIGWHAFEGCTSLESITIPDSVTSIGYFAFYNCSSLESITIPDSVTSIGNAAFSGCTSLTSITIPDSVTSIGYDAFYNCSSLTIYGYSSPYVEIYAKNHNLNFVSKIKGDLDGDGEKTISDYSALKMYISGNYNMEGKALNYADINSDGTVDAFDLFALDKLINNIGLTDFNYTVTSGNNAKITGYNASDVNIKIPARIDGYTITNIDNYAFKANTSIKSVKVIEGIKAVNYGAFLNCTALETVELPNTITSIASYGFKGCSNLAKITIPASVTSIQATAFDNCPNLKIYGEQGSYAQTFANDKGIPFICFSYEVISGNNVKITGYNGDENELTIPAKLNGYNVTTIYNYAFRNNANIKKIKLERGIKTISYGAFLNCSNLQTVELPETVTSIASYGFKGCTKLTKITIPASVTSINANSFTDCPNVTIYGKSGSYAQTFANTNNISFVVI